MGEDTVKAGAGAASESRHNVNSACAIRDGSHAFAMQSVKCAARPAVHGSHLIESEKDSNKGQDVTDDTKRLVLNITQYVLYHCPVDTPKEQLLRRLFAKQAVLRSRDLESQGITRVVLSRYVRAGLVARVGRGLYTRADHSPSENHSLVQVAKRVPDAVFCLLTALRFHGLTTQSPHEVWIALPASARKPRLDYPKIQVARFSGAALTQGIDVQRVEGVSLRVYSPAKTVADCFKYRNKLGIDVAVEALRDFSRRHRGGANELSRYARICRVSRVMQPYLDAMI